jgi:hypothetical protein
MQVDDLSRPLRRDSEGNEFCVGTASYTGYCHRTIISVIDLTAPQSAPPWSML